MGRLMKIMIGVVMLLIAFIAFPLIGDAATSVISSENITYTGLHTLVSITPTVTILVLIVGAFILVFTEEAIVRYRKWVAFGNRLKEAYAAKFGGENTGFNEEVDMRIKAMRAMGGKSQTKDIAEDWLKRMAAFVEVPWAIPEEEHESEEEKTNNFDDEDETEDEEL